MSNIVGYIKDQENNYYPVVRIGFFYYLAASLRVTKFRDGGDIPSSLITINPHPSYPHFYSFELAFPKDPTGSHWKGNIYPDGVKPMTATRWKRLLEVAAFDGGRLKSANKITSLPGFAQPNKGAVDTFGFNVLPNLAKGKVARIWVCSRYSMPILRFISSTMALLAHTLNYLTSYSAYPYWLVTAPFTYGMCIELYSDIQAVQLRMYDRSRWFEMRDEISTARLQVRGFVSDPKRIISPSEVPYFGNIVDSDPLFYAGGL